ncbi:MULTISPECIES: AI-2E family transporter [Methylotenera]|uniref:AI-2E family transporter n=1 Tax=Methylotenera TaxID=359407 RepID=UPI00036F82AD|nr:MULTISPECIES: AI-2E family transporter [Methylotenera]
MPNQPKNSRKPLSDSNIVSDNRWLILSAVFLLLLYFLAPVLTPFLTAAILAYMCDPLVDRLSILGYKKYQFGRTTATVLVMMGLVGVITLLLLIIIPLLQKESQLIIERLPNFITSVRTIAEPWLQKHFGISLAIDSTQIQDVITKNWKTAGGVLGDVLKTAGTNSMALVGVVANILLLPVVLFYLLRDWDEMIAGIGNLIPRHIVGKTTEIAQEIDQMLAEFLRGQFTVMIIMSVFYALGLWLTGLEMALPIGIIAGLLGFIPYLGPAIGLGLALLVGALHFSSFGQLIPVLLVFGLGQLIESNFITPKLVGDRIGLHPVVVIFALLAGGQLFGFAGVLLALPVSAMIAVGLRRTKDSYLDSDTYLK